MLSIEPLSLMIKMRCGTPAEVTQAQVLLPIILKRHRLLVTLLLINSLANEALPLFLDKIVPSHVAILLSVTAVLIFGEILPTAYGRIMIQINYQHKTHKKRAQASTLPFYAESSCTLYYCSTRRCTIM
jgi:hypothetical protein